MHAMTNFPPKTSGSKVSYLCFWFCWGLHLKLHHDESSHEKMMYLDYSLHIEYGNTGCRVFKRGTKSERPNQHTRRKLVNFENWCSGKLSKIGRHFSDKVI